ncbi:MAG: hypothetical protein IJK27_03235, partial [Bacilli bacterium]|nr:hypothetical protein [Bacilli bacterium]
MMRALFESSFYVIYLVFILGLGIYFIKQSLNSNKRYYILFGLACLILGIGDAFHLVPRAVGLFNKTLDNPSVTLAMWLGIGKLITSVTMTIFYVLVYLFIFKRIGIKRYIYLDIIVCVLFISRIVLLVLPQNDWINNSNDMLWGIYRNIPFVLLGILVIILCFIYFNKIKCLRLLGYLIILSFLFYLPVVIFAGTYSWVGMLMLPKTICYMVVGVI